MILKFKKGTQTYEAGPAMIGAVYYPKDKLDKDIEIEYDGEIAADKYIYYENALYLKASDSDYNFLTNKIVEKTKENTQKAFSKFIDFFYEEEPAKKHLEEDENGNMIEVEDAPKRSINWFKVGACSTSVTLMIIGAIIMLIKKHH